MMHTRSALIPPLADIRPPPFTAAARATEAIAIGLYATVDGPSYGIAIGASSLVNQESATAVGYSTEVQGTRGTAIGAFARAEALRTTALGEGGKSDEHGGVG